MESIDLLKFSPLFTATYQKTKTQLLANTNALPDILQGGLCGRNKWCYQPSVTSQWAFWTTLGLSENTRLSRADVWWKERCTTLGLKSTGGKKTPTLSITGVGLEGGRRGVKTGSEPK